MGLPKSKMMKLTLLGLSAFVQLASCWPVQEYFYLETQLQGGRVMTFSHGSMNMQHGQRLDTQLWGLDEEIGCLRSKTSDYLCLTAGATGSLSLGTENGDAEQKWEMRDDGVLTNQMDSSSMLSGQTYLSPQMVLR